MLTAGSAALLMITAAGVTSVITWLLASGARRSPRPGAPEAHPGLLRSQVPRTGGVAIVLGFSAGVAVALSSHGYQGSLFAATRYHWALWILAGTGLVLFGLIDDLRGLGPGTKFLAQTVAALSVYAAGFRIEFIGIPGFGPIDFGWFALPATILWIVGVTNAINLIDGLDGLATGIGLIACVTIGAIACLQGVFPVGVIALSLAGALSGFLPFNATPARIFLGDSGSQFLGFTLAVISIRGLDKNLTAVAILVPMLILGVPIWDTLLVIARRAWRIGRENGQRSLSSDRIAAWRGLFERDREHVHYNLVDLGLSERRAVGILYGTCVVLCLAALGLMFLRLSSAALIAAVAVGVEVGVVKVWAARRRLAPERCRPEEGPC